MDILAARKKAAERAKGVEASTPVAAPPAREPHEPEESVPAFPPLPDTAFLPDERLAITEPVLAPHPQQESAEETKATPAAYVAPAPEPEQEQQPQQEMLSPAGPAAAGIALEPAAPEQTLEMLSFLLGSEEYVVPVEQVREILTPKEITPVPHTADHLLGVCSLRGTVMPVIDLNRRLGLPASEREEKSRIVVVSLGRDDQVGLFVDRVRGVVRFLSSAVRPAPDTVEQGSGAEFLKGIVRKDDRLYILLDVEKTVGA